MRPPYGWQNWQIWQLGIVHGGAFLLAKSATGFDFPAKCCTTIWNLLAVDKNVIIRGLALNSPLHSFSKACAQSLLSISTRVLHLDSKMKGLKCRTETAIAKASTSHGNHFACPGFNFALKKPATCRFPSCITYSVEPMPGCLTAASVIIHNSSSGLGRVITRVSCNDLWACVKAADRLSLHSNLSFDFAPAMEASRGYTSPAQCGRIRASVLKAPTKNLMPLTVVGGRQLDRMLIRWGVAIVPCSHSHPRIVVDFGHTTVFPRDNFKFASENADKWRCQL